jgi:xylulokinase
MTCPAAPCECAWISFRGAIRRTSPPLLESVAYEYAFYLNILRAQIGDLTLVEARAIGGGARSLVWNQIKADVLGVPYQRLQGDEFGTWGSALIAGKAAGLFDDLGAAAAEGAKAEGEPVRPNPLHRDTYQRLVEEYLTVQETLRAYFQ